jgi:DNA-binding CsgD family transcriptional regulator
MKAFQFTFILLVQLSLLTAQEKNAIEINKAKQLYDSDKFEEALGYIRSSEMDTTSYEMQKLLGDIHYQLYHMSDAIAYYRECVRLGSQMADIDPVDYGEMLILLTEAYSGASLFEQSINTGRRALEWAKNIKNESHQADAMFNMATSFARMSAYDSAIFYIQLVFEIDLKSGDSLNISSDYNTLGYLHMQNEEFSKGLNYYEQALAFQPRSDSFKLALRLSNIAFAHMQLANFDQAEREFNRSLEMYRSLNMTTQMAKQMVNLGMLYKKQQLLLKAVELQEKGVEYFDMEDNDYNKVRANLQLIETLMDLNRYDEAASRLQSTIAIAENSQLLEEQVQAYKLLVDIQDQKKLISEAYYSIKKYLKLKDSLNKEQRLSEIHDLELRFVTSQKEQEIQLLELKNQLNEQELNRRNRNILYLGIGLVGLMIFTVVIYLLQRQKMKLQESLHSKEIDEMRLHIKTLIGEDVKVSEFTIKEINADLNEPLSDREFEILKAISSSQSNKEIAESLFISINTVKFHLKKVYEKLGVANRKEALHYLVKSSG